MKIKSLFASMIFTLSGFMATSQTSLVLVKPAGSKEWGFVNLSDEYVIQPKFRKVGEFSPDGYAPVYEDRKYYFINASGDKLQTEASDYRLKNFFGFGIRGFENGMAPVEINKKWGYINKEGKLAIEAKYDEATEFRDGYAAASRNGKWYILNKDGKEVEVSIPKLKNLKEFNEGLAAFDTEDRKFGFVNTKGEVVVQPQFMSVGEFANGMAWAKNESEMYGYINAQGEWVIKPTYDATRNFDGNSGMARVKKGDEWFFIDKTGTPLKIDLDRYDDFYNGLARAKKGEMVGFIDKSGNWVIEAKYEGARDFQNGYAAVKSDGKWGIINEKGEWVIKPKYDGIRDVVVLK